MWLRRIVACLLLLAPVQASAASIFAVEHGHGGCTDHVCACVKSCPLPKGKKPQAVSCHGNEAPAGPLMNAAGCGHRKEAVPPAMAMPHVIPSATSGATVEPADPVPSLVDAARLTGFIEIDLPPPRPLS